MEEIHAMEQFFINLQNIFTFVCQMCFFILCDRAVENKGYEEIKESKSVVIALTSILFYSVFGYFMSRIRDICQRSRYRTVQAAPSLRNYFKWLCKIFFEWLKAVVVVLCLREQGIHYEPKISYSLITFCYYVCSEKIFLDIFPTVVEFFNIEYLDDMEHLYVPLVLNSLTILAGVSLETYMAIVKFSNFVLISFYFIVYLRVKDLYHNNWKILKAERAAYSSFQVATKSDIQLWDDICAVCLNRMSRARITPCNHLFHPYCLKQCLKTSFYCPLCKQHFIDKDQK
nr:unnamed protein product [Callosobruchus chinensis]